MRKVACGSVRWYGIDDLLPDDVELVHGPGCPVCVIPMGHVDDGIAIAHQPIVIFSVRAGRERRLDQVVLSGGVFQNRRLLERTHAHLTDAGLRPLVPRRLPPNDGGIAYGQAAVAAARGGP